MSGNFMKKRFRDKEKTKKTITYFVLLVILISFFSILFGIFVFSIGIAIYFHYAHQIFMEKFAKEHNFGYGDKLDVSTLKGRLFSISNRENAGPVIFGKHEHYPIKIFNYYYTVGSGKNSTTYGFTVSEIEISKTIFPYIFLRSKTMPYHSQFSNIFNKNKDRKISLEKQYDKKYTLYAREDFEIEALQIFTPEILEYLQKESSHFSIEFAGNKIYIYDDLTLRTTKRLQRLLDTTIWLAENIGPLSERLHDDFNSLYQAYDQKN